MYTLSEIYMEWYTVSEKRHYSCGGWFLYDKGKEFKLLCSIKTWYIYMELQYSTDRWLVVLVRNRARVLCNNLRPIYGIFYIIENSVNVEVFGRPSKKQGRHRCSKGSGLLNQFINVHLFWPTCSPHRAHPMCNKWSFIWPCKSLSNVSLHTKNI